MGGKRLGKKGKRSRSSSNQSNSSTDPPPKKKPSSTEIFNETLSIECARFEANAKFLTIVAGVNDVDKMRGMVLVDDDNIKVLKEARHSLIKKLDELTKSTEATTSNEPSAATISGNLPNEELFNRYYKQISTLAVLLTGNCAEFSVKAKSLCRLATTDDVEKVERMVLVTDDNIRCLLNARDLLNKKLSTFEDANQYGTTLSDGSTGTAKSIGSGQAQNVSYAPGNSPLTLNSLESKFNKHTPFKRSQILKSFEKILDHNFLVDNMLAAFPPEGTPYQ